MVKTKTLTLTLTVPKEYKYIAVHPWGGISLFKEKPELMFEEEEWGNGVEKIWNWKNQKDELEIGEFASEEEKKNWKNSIREIFFIN